MDDTEMRKWNASRRELFDVELPAEVQARIDARIALLDYERAMKALAVYRAERPYKGFFIARFNWHYQTVPAASTDRAEGPAARPTQSNEIDSERHERAAYAQLPPKFIEDCREWFRDWGWAEGSRGWVILCLDAFAGKPVEQYKVNPLFGSAAYDKAERIRKAAEAYDRQRLEAIICRMYARLKELGDDCADITGFSGLGRATGAGCPGDAARQKMRRALANGMAAAVIVGAAKPRSPDAEPVHPLDRCV